MSYVSLQKSQLLDSIESHVLYADLCCVVVGQKGIGKSFFADELAKRLNGKVYLSQIQALPDMTLHQLEKSISMQLGLGWQDTEQTLYEKIEQKLDQRALLIIDNAHLLSLASLEYLMALVLEQFTLKKTSLYLVLTGISELAEHLSKTISLINNPNICAVFELQAIQSVETKSLVADFQAIDEGTVEALYDEQKIHYLWELSRGNPAELKYQLERWLAESNVQNNKVVKFVNVRKKYLLSLMYTSIAVSLLIVLIFQDDINQAIEGSDQLVNSESTSDKSLQTSKKTLHKKIQVDSFPVETLTKHQKKKIKTQKLPEKKAVKKEVQLVKSEPKKIAPIVPLVILEKSEDNALTDASLLESNNKQTENINEIDSSVNIQSKNKKVITPIKKAGLTNDELKLNQYLDNQYILQWVAVSSFESANKFRASHPLKDKMLIFRRKQNNIYLFFVVSEQLNSRNDAEHTRIIYLKRAYPGKAWVKSAKAMKQDISMLP